MKSDTCTARIEREIQAIKDNPGNEAIFDTAQATLRMIIDCKSEVEWMEQQTGTICTECEHCPLRENVCLLSTDPGAQEAMNEKRVLVANLMHDKINDDELERLGQLNEIIDGVTARCTCLIDRVYHAWSFE